MACSVRSDDSRFLHRYHRYLSEGTYILAWDRATLVFLALLSNDTTRHGSSARCPVDTITADMVLAAHAGSCPPLLFRVQVAAARGALDRRAAGQASGGCAGPATLPASLGRPRHVRGSRAGAPPEQAAQPWASTDADVLQSNLISCCPGNNCTSPVWLRPTLPLSFSLELEGCNPLSFSHTTT